MISPLELVLKCLHSKLLTACILILSLTVTSVALAGYNPPKEPPSEGNTTSTGSRGGCSSNTQGKLTVLAPINHVGQTASVRPTFAWFVPDTEPFQMEFQVFELTENNGVKPIEKLELKSSPGIMKVSLPENKPGLTVGKRYRWQVTILCNPNHPSTASFARAEFQVVQMSSTLRSALSTAKEPAQMVELYAVAGLWYDALGEALRSAPPSRLGQAATNLLDDLAKTEKGQQSESLKQIASSVR